MLKALAQRAAKKDVLPRSSPAEAVEKDAKKQVQCSRCGAVFVGRYRQWGTKKFCHKCFEVLEAKWKKDKEEKMAGRILEPAFDEQGRTVCPQCLTQDKLEVVDYGLTKTGLYFFIHECKKCRVKFRYETDMRTKKEGNGTGGKVSRANPPASRKGKK